jgi:hypothetical protein
LLAGARPCRSGLARRLRRGRGSRSGPPRWRQGCSWRRRRRTRQAAGVRAGPRRPAVPGANGRPSLGGRCGQARHSGPHGGPWSRTGDALSPPRGIAGVRPSFPQPSPSPRLVGRLITGLGRTRRDRAEPSRRYWEGQTSSVVTCTASTVSTLPTVLMGERPDRSSRRSGVRRAADRRATSGSVAVRPRLGRRRARATGSSPGPVAARYPVRPAAESRCTPVRRRRSRPAGSAR